MLVMIVVMTMMMNMDMAMMNMKMMKVEMMTMTPSFSGAPRFASEAVGGEEKREGRIDDGARKVQRV